jgi:hypothetical protein
MGNMTKRLNREKVKTEEEGGTKELKSHKAQRKTKQKKKKLREKDKAN